MEGTVGGSKRQLGNDDEASSAGRIFVPQEDLTRNNYDSHADLTDRQKLAWAYQTETKVRFDKLQGNARTTTLQSDYLLDIYPDTSSPKTTFTSIIERDKHSFERKIIPSLRVSRLPDGTLTPILLEGYDDDGNEGVGEQLIKGDNNPISGEWAPVPPNFLYFEMILQAFMGHSLDEWMILNIEGAPFSGRPVSMGYTYGVLPLNSNDPTMPRGAVMGGAVVAALSSWSRYEQIIDFQNFAHRLFAQEEDAAAMTRSSLVETIMKYTEMKADFIREIHEVFLSHPDFRAGDVDIFLQMSPLTRSLHSKLSSSGLTADTIDHISSYCGGIGVCHGDLQRFAERTMARVEPGCQGPDGSFMYEFVFSLAKNGLSFMFAPEELEHARRRKLWPRVTQLIMLNHRADLLGALLDFDLSIACCAYDGNTVRVAPRAAYSLQTRTCVSTPYTLEERRNRTRVVKYSKRGFNPAVIDPCCTHEVQCENYMTKIKHQTYKPSLDNQATWSSGDLHSEDRLASISEAQKKGVFDLNCCGRRKNSMRYSLAMFEKSEGDATEYLSRLHNWSEEYLAEVKLLPNERRQCCRLCRNDYGVHIFIKDEFPTGDTVDDVLHGEKAFRFSSGVDAMNGHFNPDFYSGGAFDSTLVRDRARNQNQALSVLRSQSRLEKARYFLKHGNVIGYQQRFVYGDDLEELFNEAVGLVLPGSSRSPIGLNPERFVSTCEFCHTWLHGKEFGAKFCDQCQNQKPAAKKRG